MKSFRFDSWFDKFYNRPNDEETRSLVTNHAKEILMKAIVEDYVRIDENDVYVENWDVVQLLAFAGQLETGKLYRLYFLTESGKQFVGEIRATSEPYSKEHTITRDMEFLPKQPLEYLEIPFTIEEDKND